ncbi:ATP-grasp domain-containing protein [Myxococcus sp. K38C18041901]|uniref:ATP-grasp domain-containing protein n=1 Tax=Myxococcus guangdongensis TaxID=2906760 RepID=UPI0020A72961|nr:ATP-grasp domain-containing protein [Myxococcus guangdongensis]MCP3062090.1 ATP-grasp domain-containing protein [Myxococcus guangdongensis]
MLRKGEDLLQVEEALWVLTAPTGQGIYDFGFDAFFACRRPYQLPESLEVVARVGVWNDYAERYRELAAEGVRLVHSPEQHLLATELPHWYPKLEDLTPRSVWFDARPDAKTVEARLGWPVFVKGERQTSRHRKSLSIIEGPEQFTEAMAAYAKDPILHWQRVVCRELRPLRRVEEGAPDRIPSSFEFRTFWWRGELVGWGPYWWQGSSYTMNEAEQREALWLGREVARRLALPFLVVDVAQEVSGRWVVIECNDGQESGYAGVSPFALWRNILELERAR